MSRSSLILPIVLVVLSTTGHSGSQLRLSMGRKAWYTSAGPITLVLMAARKVAGVMADGMEDRFQTPTHSVLADFSYLGHAEKYTDLCTVIHEVIQLS